MECRRIVEQPLVSIVTPSYNQGAFIEQTILSIRNQTYPNIEHIIVDGGSTDATLDVIRKHEGTYNMRWLSEPDKGAADAINKGFDMARGEIVTWINSDDIYVASDAVEKVVEAFRAYPAADIVAGDGIYMHQNGRWLYSAAHWRKSRACYKHLRYTNSLIQPSTFFRRHVVEDCRCDITFHYAFDWDLFVCMARKYNVLPIDDIIAGFRIHPAQKGGATTGFAAAAREITRRHLGAPSPQYALLTFYHGLFRATDLLPRPLRIPIQQGLSKLSAIITALTFRRVASV